MTEKPSNPKKVYGDTKVGLSSVPMGPLYALAIAMAEGGMKYGKHNYRDMGCRHSTYFDAAVGHLVSWWEGEDVDPDSGEHHLMKAAASIFVMYDSILMGNDNDDRPIRYTNPVPLRNNPKIVELQKKYPNPKEPFTEKGRVSKNFILGPYKEDCQSTYKDFHCSDCKHYSIPFADAQCAAGKTLILLNPEVGKCPYFERKKDENK